MDKRNLTPSIARTTLTALAVVASVCLLFGGRVHASQFNGIAARDMSDGAFLVVGPSASSPLPRAVVPPFIGVRYE